MKKIILTIASIMAIIVAIGYIPVKFAKNIEDFDVNSDEYVICYETAVTGADWYRILEYDKAKTGNLPFEECATDVEEFNFVTKESSLSYRNNLGLSTGNAYIVYGEHLKEPIEDEFYDNVAYTFEAWDIIYPVDRNTIFGSLLPKSYICVFDWIGLP